MNLSDYELVKKLDKGNFGSIEIVRRKEDNEEFVVKKQEIDQFSFNEIAIMSKLCHPNIVTFYNSWEEEEYSYILMEYVSGISLYNLIYEAYKDDRMPMTEQEALDFFAQMALAVNYMHQQDVIHRDLKPENVLLTGTKKVVKILDFGISVDVSSDLDVGVLNPNSYTAPEHSTEEVPHTFKSDIWSIGALLYETVTLSSPEGLKDNLEPLEDLSGAIKDVLQKVLILSPDERPDSCEVLNTPELIPALKNYYESLETSAQEIIEEQIKDLINAENAVED